MNRLLTTTLGKSLNILSHIAPEKTGEIGFQLFCYPARPRLKEKHKEYLHSARWKKLGYGKYYVQVYRWGEGKRKVFFAHGWQSHTYRWKPYINQLDPNEFTVYAMDAPGHGLSSGRHLSLPLYGDMIEKVWQMTGPIDVMVGHSMGSFGLLYALEHHTHLAPGSLILLAPPSNAHDFFTFYKNVLQLSDKTVDLTMDYFIGHFNNTPDYYSARNFARGLSIPGLIIHDAGDMETPLKNAEEIHEVWPASSLHVTSGFGHNLRSHEVVDKVLDFIG
jgi:pimeloyl-ACP methyl ester carboxylesterase